MRKIFLLFFLFIYIISCYDKIDPIENVVLNFYPRECNFVWVDFLKQIEVTPNGEVSYILEEINNNECNINNIIFTIYTSNIDTLPKDGYSPLSGPYSFQQHIDEKYQDLDEHNIKLEKQLEDDYRKSISSSKSDAISKDVNTYLENWEYRTTGIEKLTISCNKTIFNQAPGTALNSYFYISGMDPHQIISSETEELIFGYQDKLNNMSIEAWIDMKPMAQPSIFLMMNEVPDELPGDFKFTVRMETTEGLEIENTSREIRILL